MGEAYPMYMRYFHGPRDYDVSSLSHTVPWHRHPGSYLLRHGHLCSSTLSLGGGLIRNRR
eukprot:1159656-Pelagomonas_calceolata.AAC.1